MKRGVTRTLGSLARVARARARLAAAELELQNAIVAAAEAGQPRAKIAAAAGVSRQAIGKRLRRRVVVGTMGLRSWDGPGR